MMLAQNSCVACFDLRTNQHLKQAELLAFVEKMLSKLNKLIIFLHTYQYFLSQCFIAKAVNGSVL